MSPTLETAWVFGWPVDYDAVMSLAFALHTRIPALLELSQVVGRLILLGSLMRDPPTNSQ